LAYAQAKPLGFKGIMEPRLEFAYVWANQPVSKSYMANSIYSHNRTPIRIHRVKTGFYSVDLGQVADYGGTAQVSAYGGNAICNAASWRRGIVNVACFDAEGLAMDARFSLVFYKYGDIRYLLANRPSTSAYTPNGPATYWPEQKIRPSILRRQVGKYRIIFGGALSASGQLRVAATGGQPGFCNLHQLTTTDAEVHCYDIGSHHPVDSAFTFIYVPPVENRAFAETRQASNGDNNPITISGWNNGQDISLKHIAPGSYKIHLGNIVRRRGGNAQVAAVGGQEHCVVQNWAADDVNIQCYSGNRPADADFNILYSSFENSTSTPCGDHRLLLHYKHMGGVRGFRINFRLYENGCYTQGNGSEARLKAEDRLQFDEWRRRWRSISYQRSDPPHWRDGQYYLMTFDGLGNEPVPADFNLIIERWISHLNRHLL